MGFEERMADSRWRMVLNERGFCEEPAVEDLCLKRNESGGFLRASS